MSETLITKIRRITKEIPPEVRHFLTKGAILFGGWCLLYGFILKPYHLVDPSLTKYTGMATEWAMQYVFAGQYARAIYTHGAVLIFLNNKEALSIWDPCNGMDLYVLFTGFILCVPMNRAKMTGYILIGIASIFVINVFRCLALVYLFNHYPGFVDIAHHYVFQMMVYAAIFILWERYFRSVKLSHETAQV